MVDPYLLVLDSVQLFWPYGITAVSVRQQAQDVAARFLIVFQCQQLPLLRLFEQLAEGAEAIVGLVEAWLAALQRLLHH